MTRRSASRTAAHQATVCAPQVARLEPQHDAHDLQRSAGNLATARWLHARALSRSFARGPLAVQRACAACEEEERSHRPVVSAALESYLHSSSSAGRPLPDSVRDYFEPRLGFDLTGVRVHTDGRAAAAAAEINARAFTTGSNVHFAAGAFSPGTSSGDRLLAHELTHVVQQTGRAASAIQRQPNEPPVGPLPDPPKPDADCSFDFAARRWRDFINCCAKTPAGSGCSKDAIKAVCKIIKCDPEPPKPIVCPPRFKPGESRDHKGKCCAEKEKSEDPRWRCVPGQIVVNSESPRCCPEGTIPDAARTNCVTPPPPPAPEFCMPGQTTTKGECCKLPLIPEGAKCVSPPPTPQPKPPSPSPVVVFFQKDKPSVKAKAEKALADSLTAQGKTNFAELVAQLRANPDLKVQLIGRASPEGTDEYNYALAERRAEIVAEVLAAEGIDSSRIANPPEDDLRSECHPVRPGVLTCGEVGAVGPPDRQVLARLFQPNP
jgi:hypothetical protein